MKKIFLLFVVFCCFQKVQSQTESVITEEAQVINVSNVEEKPEFPGGENVFYKFIANNFNIPDVKGGLNGKVIISFVVEKDGSLTDFKIINDLGYGTGDEVIRVLRLCPKWKPAKQKGTPIRCSYTIPITINTKED